MQTLGPDAACAGVQELTSLFLKATELFLDFRSAEVGSAVFDKVTTAGMKLSQSAVCGVTH